MFWKNEYDYSIIDDEITDKDLQEFLKENNIFLDIVDNSTRWCAFAQYYGRKYNLSDLEAASFSNMISIFMTGMSCSAGTEIYFKEEKIEYTILDYYNTQKQENELERVKDLFYFIFNLYQNNISNYEFQDFRLEFRVSQNILNKFNSVEGDNKKEKLLNLLDYYFKQ